MSLDARLTLARPDLASRSLEGLVRADRYVETVTRACAVPIASIRAAAAADAEQKDELLLGERFEVAETADGWCWGQALRDGYVGYVQAEALAPPGPRPTHRVRALLAQAYAEPDVRTAARGPFVLNSLVAETAREGRFVHAAGAGWFVADALAPVGRFETDWVAIAERMTGSPYLWGGRSALGVDCSGLVQAALFACGRACPRDSDQQAQALGRPIEPDAFGRGDLVFWRGHVAIGLGQERVLHANSAAMAVSIDTLADALDRNRAVYGEPVAWRRV